MKANILALLVWIGLTRKKANGDWFVPFYIPANKDMRGWKSRHWYGIWPYFFRNTNCNPWFHRADYNPRRYNRLLPFRWGFGWMGYELGDRGGEHMP